MITRHAKRALADVLANRFLNAVTVVTVSLAVLIVSAALLFFVNTRGTLAAWQQEIRILAYLRAEAGADAPSVKRAIEAIDGVRHARFLPREEALRELKAQMPEQVSLFDHLEENPLPDAFEIELTPAAEGWERIDAIAARLGALPAIEAVEYGRKWVATLQGIIRVLRAVGAAMIGLFFVAAVSIVASTTRLVIFSRREEVEIMRLVGAAEGFIKTPFYLTGLAQGLVGGAAGLAVLFGLFNAVMDHIGTGAWTGVLPIRFLSVEEMGAVIAGSTLVGGIGAFISLRQRPEKTTLGAIALVVLLMTAPAGLAADPAAPAAGAPLENLRQEAEAVGRDIQERQAEIDRIRRREEDMVTALETRARALHLHRRQAQALKAELEQLESQVASTRAAEADLLRRIRAREAYLSKRLAALYTIRRLGTTDMLASSASMLEAVKRKAALERIVSHDEQIQRSLLAYSAELQQLRSRLTGQQEEQRSRAAGYDRQLAAVNREQSHREKLLADIRTDKLAREEAVGSLQAAAQMLERKIQSLARPPGAGAGAGAGGPAAAGKPITASKGLLIFPVKGKIANLYGPYRHPRLNVPAFRSGIDIAAERGEPVKAVHAGTIVYSSWFKGYGNVVIIDHGDHFYSVYAHLEDVFKSVDNRVEAGDVIATTGDSGAMGAAGLYFELRHHDRAIDPLEWLQRG
jgi:cell division protein FtsX/murein DD-endopeptidase MepM/ murein hydrolase activator NlpD